MSRSLYVGIPLILLLVILQTSLLPYLQLGGVTAQLAVLAAISWGLQRGAAEGMVWAFITGMLLDAFSFAPQGTTALALMVAIFVTARVQQLLPENPVLLPVLLTALCFTLYLLLSLVILWLTGHAFSWLNVSLLLPSVVLHGLLGLPASWLARTLDRLLFPRPIEV
jgi:rod shape-determining protein MreD